MNLRSLYAPLFILAANFSSPASAQTCGPAADDTADTISHLVRSLPDQVEDTVGPIPPEELERLKSEIKAAEPYADRREAVKDLKYYHEYNLNQKVIAFVEQLQKIERAKSRKDRALATVHSLYYVAAVNDGIGSYKANPDSKRSGLILLLRWAFEAAHETLLISLDCDIKNLSE